MKKICFNIVIILFIFSSSFLLCYKFVKPPVIELEGTCDLYKTVDHVDLSKYEDLVKVYSDSDNDIAYYMYIGDRDTLKVGDTVHLSTGEDFKVISTDCIGFLMEPIDRSPVTFGYSGMGVLDNTDTQVGVISYVQDDCVYCIWT